MTTTPRTRATQLGAIGFAAVALGCAAFAAFLVSRLMSARGFTGDRVRPVVVAKHPLPAARPITPDDVDVMSWPEKHVPAGVVADPKELFAGGKPLIPTTAILEGEAIVPSRLADPRKGTALAALVRDGYRAVAVKVDDTVGRAGLVYPGALVDVVGTFKNQDHLAVSTVAVSSVRVLAVEDETDVATRRARPSGDNPNDVSKNSFYGTVVTLEVEPESAEIVSLIAREGKIDLALRNGTDDKPVAVKDLVPLPTISAEEAAAAGIKPSINALPASTAIPTAATLKRGSGRRSDFRAVDSARERQGDKPEIETYHAR